VLQFKCHSNCQCERGCTSCHSHMGTAFYCIAVTIYVGSGQSWRAMYVWRCKEHNRKSSIDIARFVNKVIICRGVQQRYTIETRGIHFSAACRLKDPFRIYTMNEARRGWVDQVAIQMKGFLGPTPGLHDCQYLFGLCHSLLLKSVRRN
jgi:hypothetical protein